MSSEDGTRPYPPHNLAPELDDLSLAYAQLEAENAELRRALDVAMAENDGHIACEQRLGADLTRVRTDRDLLRGALHQVEAALAATRADAQALQSRLDEWQATASQALRAAVVAEDELKTALVGLEAARKVVAAAREPWATDVDVMNAIADYDTVVKGGAA